MREMVGSSGLLMLGNPNEELPYSESGATGAGEHSPCHGNLSSLEGFASNELTTEAECGRRSTSAYLLARRQKRISAPAATERRATARPHRSTQTCGEPSERPRRAADIRQLFQCSDSSFYAYSTEEEDDGKGEKAASHDAASLSTVTAAVHGSSLAAGVCGDAGTTSLAPRPATSSCGVSQSHSSQRSVSPVQHYFEDGEAAIRVLQQYEHRRPNISAMLQRHAQARRRAQRISDVNQSGRRGTARALRRRAYFLEQDSSEEALCEMLQSDSTVRQRTKKQGIAIFCIAGAALLALTIFLDRIDAPASGEPIVNSPPPAERSSIEAVSDVLLLGGFILALLTYNFRRLVR